MARGGLGAKEVVVMGWPNAVVLVGFFVLIGWMWYVGGRVDGRG